MLLEGKPLRDHLLSLVPKLDRPLARNELPVVSKLVALVAGELPVIVSPGWDQPPLGGELVALGRRKRGWMMTLVIEMAALCGSPVMAYLIPKLTPFLKGIWLVFPKMVIRAWTR